jgi:methylenetetrahydrofolate dehydrogenase (NADP+)/methenyltetrahydrofolate cyclohydrolase
MAASILKGKPLADLILAETAKRVSSLKDSGVEPALALVRVGDDPASQVYLRKKREACISVGIRSVDLVYPGDSKPLEILAAIRKLNRDASIHGILVQFPFPKQLSQDDVISEIDPLKDVDGFHPLNAGRLASGLPAFIPCTPLGVALLLRHHGVDLAGKLVVIAGRSTIVGRPLATLLSRKAPGLDATVLLAHSRSGDLGRYTRQADVVVAAMGRPGVIRGEMLKPGAVVIDVGINRVPDPDLRGGARLVGDVDFESAKDVASMLTPVPGGVGPLTVACLCRNAAAAAAGRLSEI